MSVVFVVLCITACAVFYIKNTESSDFLVEEYEASAYAKPLYREPALFAEELCVASGDVAFDGAPDTADLHAAALFDVNGRKVDFAGKIHERLYPASTTKILTALVAIKNGNLSDVVTVSENASAASFNADEQVCGIMAGDQITLEDLLYGLLLHSGNDNAVAIAEHIGGSVEAFADMMNAQAQELMATNSHFSNPSGLHDEDHYTTAYDLYLIFNECIKYPEFVDIIQSDSYTAHITGADGTASEMEFFPTNYYAAGIAALPQSGTVIGGKTGTTDEAGSCLILLDEDGNKNPYISIVMGAETKDILYSDMTAIIEAIPAN